jgi:hypothetical protein
MTHAVAPTPGGEPRQFGRSPRSGGQEAEEDAFHSSAWLTLQPHMGARVNGKAANLLGTVFPAPRCPLG